MYTGLSFSFCVRDIAKGLVPLDQVDRIIASTAASTPDDWNQVIREYKEVYWCENPIDCERIARNLINAGQVDQPRLWGVDPPNIAAGHWLHNGVQVRL